LGVGSAPRAKEAHGLCSLLPERAERPPSCHTDKENELPASHACLPGDATAYRSGLAIRRTFALDEQAPSHFECDKANRWRRALSAKAFRNSAFSQLICPTSDHTRILSIPLTKNISLYQNPKSAVSPTPSRLGTRGGSRSSRHARRDAMDAGGIVRRAMPSRTTKSCGPGAPGLALSLLMMICRRR
jgi:hypothetical protein